VSFAGAGAVPWNTTNRPGQRAHEQRAEIGRALSVKKQHLKMARSTTVYAGNAATNSLQGYLSYPITCRAQQKNGLHFAKGACYRFGFFSWEGAYTLRGCLFAL